MFLKIYVKFWVTFLALLMAGRRMFPLCALTNLLYKIEFDIKNKVTELTYTLLGELRKEYLNS